MSDLVEEFDPGPFEQREREVLAVLAQHITALRPRSLRRLRDEGAVLVDLQILEDGRAFSLEHLTLAFVGTDESVADVERRVGKDWVSSFSWLKDDDEAVPKCEARPNRQCHQDILMQVISFDWFELVLWALEERWLSEST